MKTYQFRVILDQSPRNEEEMLCMADAIGDAGCLDASVGGHEHGTEVVFDRRAESLQLAISSAVTAIEKVGYTVRRVEMQRESITAE
jgi:hypothetical protein